MGYLGKQLFASRPALVHELQRAYADEWFAHYNFLYVARLLGGPLASAATQLLDVKGHQALERALALAERLRELGEEPTPKLTDLPQFATNKPFKLPRHRTDVEGVLKAVLDAERTSLRTYYRLYGLARQKDPLTEQLALRLLKQAVEGEESLERLLGDAASEMTGR